MGIFDKALKRLGGLARGPRRIDGVTAIDLPPCADERLLDLRARYEAAYLERFGAHSGKGFFSEGDWRRTAFTISRAPAEARRVLDVGSGIGVLLNYFAMMEEVEIASIDIHTHSKFLSFHPDATIQRMSIDLLGFDDDAFDATFCLEVIEHLDDATLETGVRELLRVTRSRLLLSVPFEEPEPLRPYHKQRFDAARLQSMFPGAALTVLRPPRRSALPWALVEVQLDGAARP